MLRIPGLGEGRTCLPGQDAGGPEPLLGGGLRGPRMWGRVVAAAAFCRPTGRMLLAFQVSFLLTMPGSQNHSQCSISSGRSLLFTEWHDVLTFYLVPAHNRPSSFQERMSEKTNPGMFGFPVMQVFSDGS